MYYYGPGNLHHLCSVMPIYLRGMQVPIASLAPNTCGEKRAYAIPYVLCKSQHRTDTTCNWTHLISQHHDFQTAPPRIFTFRYNTVFCRFLVVLPMLPILIARQPCSIRPRDYASSCHHAPREYFGLPGEPR